MLQIMQKGTRTTLCEHSEFAGGDVWAHHQFLLRRNGDNHHGCTPLDLYASMQAAQAPTSNSLTEKAVEIEKTISVKEHERERHDFDPTMFYENCS